jgi:hypothetical protein
MTKLGRKRYLWKMEGNVFHAKFMDGRTMTLRRVEDTDPWRLQLEQRVWLLQAFYREDAILEATRILSQYGQMVFMETPPPVRR